LEVDFFDRKFAAIDFGMHDGLQRRLHRFRKQSAGNFDLRAQELGAVLPLGGSLRHGQWEIIVERLGGVQSAVWLRVVRKATDGAGRGGGDGELATVEHGERARERARSIIAAPGAVQQN
jgi:hypothetical protein